MSDNDNGKHELCREVGRCHAVIMQQEQIIALLRAEVKAWRDWRKLVVRYMTCEQPDPTVKIEALKEAMTATDAAKALGE